MAEGREGIQVKFEAKPFPKQHLIETKTQPRPQTEDLSPDTTQEAITQARFKLAQEIAGRAIKEDTLSREQTAVSSHHKEIQKGDRADKPNGISEQITPAS